MKDQLKSFIQEHKEEFDDFGQDLDSLWNGIDESLAKKYLSKNKIGSILKIAATVAVLLVVSKLYINYQNTDHQLPIEVLEARLHYQPQIEYKLELVKLHERKLHETVIQDIEELDVIYKDLKKDFKDRVGDEYVIDAMIQNYRAKIRILNEILREIDNEKNIGYGKKVII